jgi:hypothetical protein
VIPCRVELLGSSCFFGLRIIFINFI